MKAQLFTMAQRGQKKGSATPFSDSATAIKKGSLTDEYLKTLLEASDQASTGDRSCPAHTAAASTGLARRGGRPREQIGERELLCTCARAEVVGGLRARAARG